MNCNGCPLAGVSPSATRATLVYSKQDDSWRYAQDPQLAHIAAMFRDPGIVDGRTVSVSLDLRETSDGRIQAGQNCWLRSFLNAIGRLPDGLRVCVDNGVRCPCPTSLLYGEYLCRLGHCQSETEAWLQSMGHPEGGLPLLLLCDKDLVSGLSQLKKLLLPDGATWLPSQRFIDCIGTQLKFGSYDALIAAHPVVVQRSTEYAKAFQEKEKGVRPLFGPEKEKGVRPLFGPEA